MRKKISDRKPLRGEIWLVIDRDKNHNGDKRTYTEDVHVQGGTRTCIIVSNNDGNEHSAVTEIVYTTTAKKTKLPTHFETRSTPKPSTVQCEQIMTVNQSDLAVCYGSLRPDEIKKLNRCLRVSLNL